jgi:hypothetical protein
MKSVGKTDESGNIIFDENKRFELDPMKDVTIDFLNALGKDKIITVKVIISEEQKKEREMTELNLKMKKLALKERELHYTNLLETTAIPDQSITRHRNEVGRQIVRTMKNVSSLEELIGPENINSSSLYNAWHECAREIWSRVEKAKAIYEKECEFQKDMNSLAELQPHSIKESDMDITVNSHLLPQKNPLVGNCLLMSSPKGEINSKSDRFLDLASFFRQRFDSCKASNDHPLLISFILELKSPKETVDGINQIGQVVDYSSRLLSILPHLKFISCMTTNGEEALFLRVHRELDTNGLHRCQSFAFKHKKISLCSVICRVL